MALDSTPLPTPSIEGPFFVHFDTVLDNTSVTSPDSMHETLQLQKVLSKFGYYENSTDGIFGDKTLEAGEISLSFLFYFLLYMFESLC